MLLVGCQSETTAPNAPTQVIDNESVATNSAASDSIYLVVLGTAQDAGSPQIGCQKSCCESLFLNPDPTRQVVALGVVDQTSQQNWLFEATPDIKTQLRHLRNEQVDLNSDLPAGIFLTHAHIGHYSGLLQLGKEAINAPEVPVYAMPKMRDFLINNAPWSQLVRAKNIALQPLLHQQTVDLTNKIQVTPLQVPHRDEFSETVGFHIQTPNKSALFIPDIDKWERWETNIDSLIQTVDYALLDATFYDNDELPGRDMSAIPHPFVVESMQRFQSLSPTDKAKVYFIHFNHTNPLLDSDSKAFQTVKTAGFNVATYDLKLPL